MQMQGIRIKEKPLCELEGSGLALVRFRTPSRVIVAVSFVRIMSGTIAATCVVGEEPLPAPRGHHPSPEQSTLRGNPSHRRSSAAIIQPSLP